MAKNKEIENFDTAQREKNDELHKMDLPTFLTLRGVELNK